MYEQIPRYRQPRSEQPEKQEEQKSSFVFIEQVIESKTALIRPVVETILQELEQAVDISQVKSKIRLALTELVTNAVIHGNLEVDSELKEVSQAAFYEKVTERESNFLYSQRVVFIQLSIFRGVLSLLVADEGSGFNDEELSLDIGGNQKPYGRGIPLVQKTSNFTGFRDGGRVANVEISLKAA